MLPSIIEVIGTDRCLTREEAAAATGHHAALQTAWDVYRTQFEGYCESRTDPMFHRLVHPAASIGTLTVASETTVLVFGNGPSAARALPALARHRHAFQIITSPRGAELLASVNLVPDLVLVEHRTALDAHHSARHVGDRGEDVLARVPLVAADWRTPASLLAHVPGERLFVPDPLPTWGCWPATAAALAAHAGASRIALLGIDLGTAERPDAAFAPLRALLDLIADVTSAATFDCGVGGAPKAGWAPCRIEMLAGDAGGGELHVIRRAAPSADARRGEACEALDRLAPLVERARRMRALALGVRAGTHHAGAALEDAVQEMLQWQHDATARIDVQEALGTTFLPRLWRLGVNLAIGQALWRPLLLATHELVAQADALGGRLRREAA